MNEIKQEVKNNIGSKSEIVGVQNNYNGISPKQACDLTLNLFSDNFPKMIAEAKKLVEERINEFCPALIKKLVDEKFQDYTVFADPDVQYVLYEAQKGYARSGEPELRKNLISLLCERCKSNIVKDIKQLTLNDSIIISPKLSSSHRAILSIIFLIQNSTSSSVNDLSSLKEYIYNKVCPFSDIKITQIDVLHLTHLGCAYMSTQHELGVSLSENYPNIFKIKNYYTTSNLKLRRLIFKDSEAMVDNASGIEIDLKTYILKFFPKAQNLFAIYNNYLKDIILTNVGIAIAIANIETRLGDAIDMSTWIS